MPITRSQIALAFGLCRGVLIGLMPIFSMVLSKLDENIQSRSRSKNRYWWSDGMTSRICGRAQSAVGLAVMLVWISRLYPCSISAKAYSKRNFAVTTMQKSQATMALAWFLINVPASDRHVVLGDLTYLTYLACISWLFEVTMQYQAITTIR